MEPKTKNKSLLENFRELNDARVIGLIIFGFIVILTTWSGLKVVQTNYELEKQIAELQQRNEVERLKNQNLQLRNEYYNSSQYLELSARRLFNKAEPGEKLYQVPESVALSKTADIPELETSSLETRTSNENQSKYEQNLEAWLDLLFNREEG